MFVRSGGLTASMSRHLIRRWARNTAACPAELPPPTTITSSRPQVCASTNIAPYPHQNLAELGVVLHERQHRLAIEHDDQAPLADTRAEQRGAPRSC